MHDLGQVQGRSRIVRQAHVVAQNGHAQRALGDCGHAGGSDAPTAAQPASAQQPLGFQELERLPDRARRDIQFLRQSRHPRQVTAPLASADALARVLGDLFGQGNSGDFGHGGNLYSIYTLSGFHTLEKPKPWKCFPLAVAKSVTL